MSKFICDSCGNVILGSFHKCPPQWHCVTDYGDPVTVDEMLSEKKVCANDFKRAAEIYCEERDAHFCDYDRERKVFVMSPKDLKIYRITVYCEAVPSYSSDCVEIVEDGEEEDNGY